MNDKAFTKDDELIGIDQRKQRSGHKLETADVEQRFRRVKAWRDVAGDLQRDNRFRQMRDHDFYDGDQWTDEDAKVLMDRGQAPLVFNAVKSTIDWIVGTERKTRVDYRVLPREKSDSDGAEAKTNLLKYVSDVNRFPYSRSRAFADAIKCGVGWMEVAIRSDPTEEPLYVGYEDWRNIWYDPHSVEPDMSDARFIFREKFVDLDVAMAMFPDRQDVIMAAAVTGAQYTGGSSDLLDDVDAERDIYEAGANTLPSSRSRVRLTECWYRIPERTKVLRGDALGTMTGDVFDPASQAQMEMIEQGHATVFDAIRMQVRCMIYCDSGVLQDEASPYRHNKLPFVPIWGFRKKRANAPYGVIRGLIDPQVDLNKRRSKALFILSTNQVIMDEGAVDDVDYLAEEVARPDGIIIKHAGKELEIRNTAQLAEEHVMLMQQDREYIESTGGVTDEMMGRETNAQSGKAILARQDQGHAVTAELFDNLRLGIQIAGELQLSLLEQYYTDEKIVRVLGDRGQAQYYTVNAVQPDGTVINDITERQADFQVDSMAFSASARQAAFESMMNIIGQIAPVDPQLARVLIDLAYDLSDLPGKDEAVKRIRAVTGQRDPDQDEDTPEDLAAAEAEASQQQREAELQAAMQQLEIAERQAKIAKTNAEAKSKEAGIILDQEKVRIQKAEALHKVQQPPKQPKIDPNEQAQGNRPMVQPFRYEGQQ